MGRRVRAVTAAASDQMAVPLGVAATLSRARTAGGTFLMLGGSAARVACTQHASP